MAGVHLQENLMTNFTPFAAFITSIFDVLRAFTRSSGSIRLNVKLSWGVREEAPS
jgi:hypothetical protein